MAAESEPERILEISCIIIYSLDNSYGKSWTIKCEIADSVIPIFLRVIYRKPPDELYEYFVCDTIDSNIKPKRESFFEKISDISCFLDEVINYFISVNGEDSLSYPKFVAKPCFERNDENGFIYDQILKF